MEPLFKPFDVGCVAIYVPNVDTSVEREEAVHDWLKSMRGRPINKGTYWFKNSGPTAADFASRFGPLAEGEGYVLLTQGESGIRLSVFGRAGPDNDMKITVQR